MLDGKYAGIIRAHKEKFAILCDMALNLVAIVPVLIAVVVWLSTWEIMPAIRLTDRGQLRLVSS